MLTVVLFTIIFTIIMINVFELNYQSRRKDVFRVVILGFIVGLVTSFALPTKQVEEVRALEGNEYIEEENSDGRVEYHIIRDGEQELIDFDSYYKGNISYIRELRKRNINTIWSLTHNTDWEYDYTYYLGNEVCSN